MRTRFSGVTALVVGFAMASCGGGSTGAVDAGGDGRTGHESGPPSDAGHDSSHDASHDSMADTAPDSAGDATGDVVVHDAAPDSGACSEATDAMKQAENCNPIDPYSSDSTHRACCPGLTCEITFDPKGDTVCQSGVGPGGQGSLCSSYADCQAGYRCTLNVGTMHRCRKFCALGASSGCPTGTTCEAFMTPAYDGKVELGLCAIPLTDAGVD